jgi:hypothetical protein
VPDSGSDTEKTRRWSGFVCPGCRCVFRVSKDHGEKGTICPSCRRILRIPGENDVSAPLLAPIRKGATTKGDPDMSEGVPKGSTWDTKEKELPNSEAGSRALRPKRTREQQVFRILSIWFSAAAAVSVSVFLFMKDPGPGKTKPSGLVDDAKDQFEGLVGNTPVGFEENPLVPIVLPEVMKRGDAEFLKLAEPLAKTFLSAKRIEDMLPVVRDPKGIWQKMREYYPEGVIEPIEMSGFNPTGRVSYKGNSAAVSITTADFEQKQLIFVEGKDGLKIDWESWAGWSEMPWEEIVEKQPVQPVLVRAILKWVDYYNFEFIDESKWRSYMLSSPDGEKILYGYVERNSPLDQMIRPAEPTAAAAVIVKIHFPENAQSPNQVVIGEYVTDGWLIAGKDE